MSMIGARSKFFHYNTLVSLLNALEGKQITVEIRNYVTLCGYLTDVHSDMSLNMSNVTRTDAKGRSSQYSRIYVRSRQVFMVHIPDEVDIVKAIKWELNKTSYFQDKEKRDRDKKFQFRQRMKQRNQARLERQGKL